MRNQKETTSFNKLAIELTNTSVNSTRFFGIPLEEISKRERRNIPSAIDDIVSEISERGIWFYKIKNNLFYFLFFYFYFLFFHFYFFLFFLFLKGLQVERIFRVNGNGEEIQSIKDLLDRGMSIDWTVYSVHTLCGVLRLW